jgi:hypothetical protein
VRFQVTQFCRLWGFLCLALPSKCRQHYWSKRRQLPMSTPTSLVTDFSLHVPSTWQEMSANVLSLLSTYPVSPGSWPCLPITPPRIHQSSWSQLHLILYQQHDTALVRQLQTNEPPSVPYLCYTCITLVMLFVSDRWWHAPAVFGERSERCVVSHLLSAVHRVYKLAG